MIRLHIVVIAALGALTFGWLFTGEHLWSVAAIVAFDRLMVNLLSRTADLKEDAANRVPGVELVALYQRPLRIMGALLAFGSIGVFHGLEPTLTLVRIIYYLLAFFYSFPVLPGRVRLKQIYIVKNVSSALGLLLTCFAYPLAKAHWGFFGLPVGVDWMTLLIIGSFFFLLELSYEILSDLSDVKGDTAAGVESFPVSLGVELSVRMTNQLLGFCGVLLVVGYAMHFLPWRITVMVVGPVIQYALFKQALRRGLRRGDAAVIAWIGAGLLGLYHTWIWLRLPGLLA